MSDRTERIMSVVRGEVDPEALGELGIVADFHGGALELSEPAGLPAVVVPARSLVDGLVAHWAKRNRLREWAQIVLALNLLNFGEVQDHPLGDELLEAIWEASSGVGLPADRVSRLNEAVAR